MTLISEINRLFLFLQVRQCKRREEKVFRTGGHRCFKRNSEVIVPVVAGIKHS